MQPDHNVGEVWPAKRPNITEDAHKTHATEPKYEEETTLFQAIHRSAVTVVNVGVDNTDDGDVQKWE